MNARTVPERKVPTVKIQEEKNSLSELSRSYCMSFRAAQAFCICLGRSQHTCGQNLHSQNEDM